MLRVARRFEPFEAFLPVAAMVMNKGFPGTAVGVRSAGPRLRQGHYARAIIITSSSSGDELDVSNPQ